MSISAVTHTAACVRKGVPAALGLAQVFGLAGCGKAAEPVEVPITQLCGKFSFVVGNKSDASKARTAFYAANVRFQGLDFADDRFRGTSKFILGGQIFELDGLESYRNRVGDPPLTLQISALGTGRNTPSVKSVPCTFPGSAIAFDNVKAAISEKWKVHVEVESPEYDRQRAKAK